MIKGIGTDLLKIARIEKALNRTPKLAQRILTDAEYSEFIETSQQGRFLAKRFAAKEAIVKALGTGIGNGVSWHHIEISKDTLGKPIVQMTEGALAKANALGAQHCLLSYSDEQEYIVAMAILE